MGTSGREVANYIGYGTANEEMKRHLGIHADFTPLAPIAVHFQHPETYRPVAGAKNVLFTMFERDDEAHLRKCFVPAFEASDLIVAPSRWCADLFEKYAEGRVPIRVCPLGVDTRTFAYRRRRWNLQTEPFGWLYCGAPNARKFTIVREIYSLLIDNFPGGRVKLYIKTTGLPSGKVLYRFLTGHVPGVVEEDQYGDVVITESCIIDNRRLPREKLPEVYWGTHGSLFLHCGEGFGLTGLEAMACGSPLVVTDWSGTTEYANRENSFPVRTEWKKVPRVSAQGFIAEEDYEGVWPDIDDALVQMERVMMRYPRAAVVGQRGAETAQRFTWQQAGNRLASILREIFA